MCPRAQKFFPGARTITINNNNNQLDIGSEFYSILRVISVIPDFESKRRYLTADTSPWSVFNTLIDDGLWWLLSQTTKLLRIPGHTCQQGGGSDARTGFEKEQFSHRCYRECKIYGQSLWGNCMCRGDWWLFHWRLQPIYSGRRHNVQRKRIWIPGELMESNYYEYGIFGYKQTLTDDATNTVHGFIVVNYWVQ